MRMLGMRQSFYAHSVPTHRMESSQECWAGVYAAAYQRRETVDVGTQSRMQHDMPLDWHLMLCYTVYAIEIRVCCP